MVILTVNKWYRWYNIEYNKWDIKYGNDLSFWWSFWW